MERIMVIGCPGSGKSTFSKELNKLTGIPLCHLDMLFWNEDKTIVPREVFRDRILDVMLNENWIMDGNYGSTMELRMRCCDTVFFLDYPLEVCLKGIRDRMGRPRSDMPWIEENEDEEFLDYVRGFGENHRPNVLELLERYKEKRVFVFNDRSEGEAYINKVMGN